jgi:uncharacterized membrane protein YbhN (UPF0104 family)
MKLISRILASKVLRWGFIAAVLAGAGYYVAEEWHDIHRSLDQIGIWASLASLAFVLCALLATMWVWRTLLAGLGSPLSFRVASRVLFIGQLGKYLPGSVWPVLAQMELATEHNVPRVRTAAASVINMGVTVLAGLLAALVTLPFTGGLTQYWWAFLVAVPLVACLYPPVLNWLLRIAFKILRRPPLEQELSAKSILTAIGWSLVCWVFFGLQIWVLMVKTGAHPLSALPLALGTYAFAFTVGFIMILAPAGAGFRDVLIVLILAPTVGTGPATAIALVSRLVTALGDVITAGTAFASYRRGKGHGAVGGPAPDTNGPDSGGGDPSGSEPVPGEAAPATNVR